MALSGALLVFVNLASQASFSKEIDASDLEDGVWTESVHGGGPALERDPRPDGDTTAVSVSLVAQVSVLQWQWSAVGIVAAGTLAGAVGWGVSRRMLQPIDRITAITNRISASNLHERIDLGGPDDELRRLSVTIDALLARLETAFESQRRFVAQASHELRTPIAVQRAALQIGLPDDATPSEVAATRAQLLEQNRRTEHLVESLLVLAEAERGLDARREPVDLVALAREVLASAQEAARRADVTLSCVTGVAPPDGLDRTPSTGEPTLVRQLLANLVDNAVEYNEPGGFVRIEVDATGLVVENSGAPVHPDDAALLTEPFRRNGGGGTHRHSGLGLSIVDAVARAHGWDLTVRARDDGGLVVRVGVSST